MANSQDSRTRLPTGKVPLTQRSMPSAGDVMAAENVIAGLLDQAIDKARAVNLEALLYLLEMARREAKPST